MDDDACVCDYVDSIFQDIGLNGECVAGGMTAAQKIVQAHEAGQTFHVVILDWKLSGQTICGIMWKVRAKLAERTPIFLAAAYDWENVEEEAYTMGLGGFLTKPFFRSTLCEGLKEFVFGKGNFQDNKKREKNFNFTGKRFLLAEDNKLNREIAIELLSATGATIDYAVDGRQCVEMFSRSAMDYYDLILMDIQMPVMNGYTAARTIRDLARKDAKSIQIWAMTADAFVEDIEKAKAFGMNGHFAKPLDIHAINSELSRFLS